MAIDHARHVRWAVLTSAALIALPSAAIFRGQPAYAAVACRSDPIVILSNGIVLELAVGIDTPVTDVRQVEYSLHVPAGVGIVQVISTDGAVGYKEKFKAKSDSSPGVYTVDARVKTEARNVAITATIAGGYASQLSITPAMVGLSSFTWTASTSPDKKGPPAPKGPKAPATLPATVTTALLSWASTAAWSVTASTPTVVKGDAVAAVRL
ncbi:MAG TPA: hypothetical protein VNL71_17240 [Chloroflexota bacterium]|nr:hypothetical protein [Chloroflexota bacterium]